MQLKSYSFIDRDDSDNALWKVQDLSLPQIALVVGRNASGKSRLLNTISNLAKTLRHGGQLTTMSGDYALTLTDNSSTHEYCAKHRNKKVISESLVVDGSLMLTRQEDGQGSIFTSEIGTTLRFKIPTNELGAGSRRDSIQHPFLEPINEWAQSLYTYRFGQDMGKQSLGLFNTGIEGSADPFDQDQVVGILHSAIKLYGARFVDDIIRDMQTLDYNLTDIRLEAPHGASVRGPASADVRSIQVYESGVPVPISQLHMSQGMFRALSVLIHLRNASHARSEMTVLIDDIGEGLDYTRSVRLIEIIQEIAKSSRAQLIMSTNDRFVMNAVPLESWIIIRRTGASTAFFSEATHPDMFEEVRYSGLSNFDFFRSSLEMPEK